MNGVNAAVGEGCIFFLFILNGILLELDNYGFAVIPVLFQFILSLPGREYPPIRIDI